MSNNVIETLFIEDCKKFPILMKEIIQKYSKFPPDALNHWLFSYWKIDFELEYNYYRLTSSLEAMSNNVHELDDGFKENRDDKKYIGSWNLRRSAGDLHCYFWSNSIAISQLLNEHSFKGNYALYQKINKDLIDSASESDISTVLRLNKEFLDLNDEINHVMNYVNVIMHNKKPRPNYSDYYKIDRKTMLDVLYRVHVILKESEKSFENANTEELFLNLYILGKQFRFIEKYYKRLWSKFWDLWSMMYKKCGDIFEEYFHKSYYAILPSSVEKEGTVAILPKKEET